MELVKVENAQRFSTGGKYLVGKNKVKKKSIWKEKGKRGFSKVSGASRQRE